MKLLLWRPKMALTRPQLMKHVKNYSNGKNAITLMRGTESALRLHKDMVRAGTYNLKGQIVEKRLIGSYLKREKMQQRRIKVYLPKKSACRPRKDVNRLLVHLLAAAFAKATATPITLNYDGSPPSPFERFVRPLLESVGIFHGSRNLVKNHMKERNFLSKTF